jgi:hypothetical protein
MNVEEKVQFYREISRVLASGGRLVFHDIFLGDAGAPSYPTPWAEDESLSWLAPVDVARAAIGESLRVEYWVDKTSLSLEWFRATLDRIHHHGAPPLGVHLLMGNTAPGKLRNVVRNLEEGRIVIAQGVATKA